MKLFSTIIAMILVSLGAQGAAWRTPACPDQFLAQLTPEARDLYATVDNAANSPQFQSFVGKLGFMSSEIFNVLLRCDSDSVEALTDSLSRPYLLRQYPQDFETNGNSGVRNSAGHGLSIYKGHIFLSDYFARESMYNPRGLGVLKQQAWIEWDRANKQFIPHQTGAESFILKSEVKGTLYRGASVHEFAYLLSIKRLIQPQFDPSQLDFVKSSVGNIISSWGIEKPEVLNIFHSLEAITQSSLQERTEAAKILISIVSRYPAIMTGTIRKTAAMWAFEMSGAEATKVVEIFDIPAMTPEVFKGFYAGTESSYFEIGFITPEARLFLISNMKDEPITRPMAEREFPHLKNQ